MGLQVPLGMIECAEVQHRKEEMLVLCKDARSFRLARIIQVGEINCHPRCSDQPAIIQG